MWQEPALLKEERRRLQTLQRATMHNTEWDSRVVGSVAAPKQRQLQRREANASQRTRQPLPWHKSKSLGPLDCSPDASPQSAVPAGDKRMVEVCGLFAGVGVVAGS